MSDPQQLVEDSLIEEQFLQELKANGRSNNTLLNYLTAIATLQGLEKKLENLKKEDLIKWTASLRDRYAEGTQVLYKAC